MNVKNSRQNEAGSLKIIMPIITVPTAPMPVHTGYAVPSGIVFVALVRRIMLRMQRIAKAVYQNIDLFPVERLPLPRQNAKPVSHSPAIIRINQFI